MQDYVQIMSADFTSVNIVLVTGEIIVDDRRNKEETKKAKPRERPGH